MPKLSLFLAPLILAVVLGPSTPAAAQDDYPITLDGHLTVEEWQDGADQPVTDEGWARLSQREDGLYLAVRSNIVGMVDVMVQRGDELHQLHVSSKLGGALFERGDDELWRLRKSYPWIDKVESREAYEAKREEKVSALRLRIANKLKPAPKTADASETPTVAKAPAPASSTPSETPPLTLAASTADPAETVAQHLKENGWTGTIFNMGDPKTAEVFLSKAFLKPGDRLLVMWQRHIAKKSFTIETFPADATPMPEGYSAVYSTEPFAHDFAKWFVVTPMSGGS
ncbi:MAG: hypothetical protein AAGM22_05415 [Acidobacteriota bacterium]